MHRPPFPCKQEEIYRAYTTSSLRSVVCEELDWRRSLPSDPLSSEGIRVVLCIEYARWGQSPQDLRRWAMSAPHARTRERALAIDEITQGSCATRVAARTGRHPQTIMGWVHAYNAQGPGTLAFRRTGGRPPFARRSQRRFVRPSAPPSVRRPPHPEKELTQRRAGP